MSSSSVDAVPDQADITAPPPRNFDQKDEDQGGAKKHECEIVNSLYI